MSIPMHSTEVMYLEPGLVYVTPDRQRTKLDVTDLLDSIRRRGVLQPIIVESVDGQYHLRAGGRRLEACRQLQTLVPVRLFATLSPIEAQLVELEENLKRKDLPWQDEIRAVGRIHALYVQLDPEWTQERTATELGVSASGVSQMLRVGTELDTNPRLATATGYASAYNTISRQDNRKVAAAVVDIIEGARTAFISPPAAIAPGALAPSPTPTPKPVDPESIHHGDFLAWAEAYSGPKFNFLHCDFPYGKGAFRKGGFIGPAGSVLVEYDDSLEAHDTLLAGLLANLDRLLSHSATIMYWFSMHRYQEILDALRPHFDMDTHPLVWVKSDNAGVSPDPKFDPRHTYETALFGQRGGRQLVRVKANHYAAPTVGGLHPSHKPEPMLRHFFEMIVDGTTRMLDPTCGSGSSLRAAESHGAESVYGIEQEEVHVEFARMELRKARLLRRA